MPTTTKKKRTSRAEQLRKRRAKKRRKALMIRALVVSVAALIVVGAVFLVVKLLGNTPEEAEKEVISAGISFEGKSLEGLTLDEAKQQVEAQLAALNWNIQVKCAEDDVVPVDNLLTGDVDAMLAKALSYGQAESEEEQATKQAKLLEEPIDFTVMELYDESKAVSFAKRLAEAKNTDTTPAALTGYDKATGEMIFSDPVPGQALDQNDLVLRIEEAIEARDFQAIVGSTFVDECTVEEIPEEYSVEAVRNQYKKIGSFFTDAAPGNAARDTNITLACGSVNGTVVKPGETFSILDAIGGTTPEKGYQTAGTYENGQVSEDIGGGICQVSTTLYNAVIKAGLNTTERHNHSLTVSYIPLGDDAMISYPNSDFKFENNSAGTIVVIMWYQDNRVWAEVYGIPILEEGVEVKMVATSTEALPIPETQYVEDPNLEPGTETMVVWPKEGFKVVTYLVTYRDGVEVSREFLHNSVYQSVGAVIHLNSETLEETSESAEETTTAEETESEAVEDVQTSVEDNENKETGGQ